jgi:hypothetical protein
MFDLTPRELALSDESLENQPAPQPLMPIAPVEPKEMDLAYLLGDSKAIAAVIDALLKRAGISKAEAARRLGQRTQTLQQYSALKRGGGRGVSLKWFLRLAAVCGATVKLHFPERSRQ